MSSSVCLSTPLGLLGVLVGRRSGTPVVASAARTKSRDNEWGWGRLRTCAWLELGSGGRRRSAGVSGMRTVRFRVLDWGGYICARRCVIGPHGPAGWEQRTVVIFIGSPSEPRGGNSNPAPAPPAIRGPAPTPPWG